MDIKTGLKTWKKKTISKSELGNIFHINSDAEMYDLVQSAIDMGLLLPVKSSGTNGNRIYPLNLKYRIIANEDYSKILSEIMMLHPMLVKNGYLKSNPEAFIKNREALHKLDQYLFTKHSDIAVSRKERSFEIFGEEKQLDDSTFCKILNHIGLSPDTLKYYDTPEFCFNDFIPMKKESMALLICENKDIWFNIRRRMYEDGASEIFDTHIDGVVYGCGNRISEYGALSMYSMFMDAKNVQYLYWGDIDRAGLNIYLSLKKNNPKMNISLFTNAYIRMLSAACNLIIPYSADHRERMGDYDEIYEQFPADCREDLIHYIDDNRRVPQEIISYECLLADMR